jgi:hypothetical protein
MILHNGNKFDPQDIIPNGHEGGSVHMNGMYTPKTLAKFACTGEKNIPMHKIGRKVVYLKSELNDWLASQLDGGVQ